MYGAKSLASHFPRNQTPSVTAGLKCPPEICPPAKIITMSAEPIASGANGPAPWPMTVHPMVRTRKKVPMSSATYLVMTYLHVNGKMFDAGRLPSADGIVDPFSLTLKVQGRPPVQKHAALPPRHAHRQDRLFCSS